MNTNMMLGTGTHGFSRTNHGFDGLEHCMPTVLAHLQRQGIDLCTITKN